jgi:hypothetical protein
VAKSRRLPTIEQSNPLVDLDPCLGKRRYETEEEARRCSRFRPYRCLCGGWHVSHHPARKGAGRI